MLKEFLRTFTCKGEFYLLAAQCFIDSNHVSVLVVKCMFFNLSLLSYQDFFSRRSFLKRSKRSRC